MICFSASEWRELLLFKIDQRPVWWQLSIRGSWYGRRSWPHRLQIINVKHVKCKPSDIQLSVCVGLWVIRCFCPSSVMCIYFKVTLTAKDVSVSNSCPNIWPEWIVLVNALLCIKPDLTRNWVLLLIWTHLKTLQYQLSPTLLTCHHSLPTPAGSLCHSLL